MSVLRFFIFVLPCATNIWRKFMASIYHKNDSPYIWIRYKSEDSKWKGKPTKYRWENFGEVRQARLLARKQTEIEQTRPPRGSRQDFDAWVVGWLAGKYGGTNRRTLESYLQTWRPLKRYLDANGLTSPHQIKREFAENYLTARTKKTSRNTAIRDIKIFGMILEEAMRREFITMNPLRRLGLKRAPAKHKEVWKDDEIQTFAAALVGAPRWMRCAFYFGLYQACRLRQCQLSLSAVDLSRSTICYPAALVKTAADFAQPIDPRFAPILEGLIAEALCEGDAAICAVPWDASLRFRALFKKLKLMHLCHHGLRSTWITRAAIAGVKEAEAMAFVFHSSREVHAVYRRLISIPTAHVPAAVSLPSIPPTPLLAGKKPAFSSTVDSVAA